MPSPPTPPRDRRKPGQPRVRTPPSAAAPAREAASPTPKRKVAARAATAAAPKRKTAAPTPQRKVGARNTATRVKPRQRAGAVVEAPPRRTTGLRWPLEIARLFLRAPGFVQFGSVVLLLLLLAPSVNWLYQVMRKPTELLFPVSGRLFKTPTETWAAYAPLFRAHSTPIMTPELLAALAQSEASGNPVARTYWRWQATLDPFEIYKPASSAVGMYQFTDGTFEEARGYCVHDHRVVADGPWHDWQSCWFNALYSRVVPTHAVELAASNLDRRVRETIARRGIAGATLRQLQDLAIVTHLCGAGAAARFAANGLQPTPGQHCGDHDLRHYVDRVHGYARTFAGLRARGGGG